MTDFNRAQEDVGNVVMLEHVNTRVPDQSLATAFYVTGTRPDARPLPDDRHDQHVDQYRPQPVPFADGRSAGRARAHRHRPARSCRPAEAASTASNHSCQERHSASRKRRGAYR